MASYAALLSLSHTLNNINIHPRPPISTDPEQLQSLFQNLAFFQDFLERHSSTGEEDDDVLESRIAAAAYAAEDVIETHIVDQTHHAGSTSDPDELISSVDLYGGLEKVVQEMDLIKREVMGIIQKKIMTPQPHPHMHTISSWAPASTWQSSAMPVFDDAIITDVLDKLIQPQSGLQIIPIVGMGGIGKTTFARNIYAKSLTVEYFDIRAWVTITQEYSRGNILKVLYQEVKGSTIDFSKIEEDDIGLSLYQHLCGRRYLIMMDDIWSVEAWDKVQSFFPKENSGSRIMITTRLSNLAFQLSGSRDFYMQFLDEYKSWHLLCEIVFDKQDCPIELQYIGKKIATKCKGLPLSIIVTGGLLKKSNMTLAYWMYTLENLNLIINLENDEYTLQILRTSYKELPVHLKVCFLYMGIFPEDKRIRTSVLITLWVAEGILRPIDHKSLEEVAKDYLKDLVERNLILISKVRWNGEAKLCKMHDLLRDICLREAQKQKLFCEVSPQKHHTTQRMDMERCICINPENAFEKYSHEFLHAVESESLMVVHPPLLRVYSSVKSFDPFVPHSDNANLRYLALNYLEDPLSFLSLCSLLWNLQTLKVSNTHFLKLTFDIWKMPLLRHVTLDGFALPEPSNGEDNFVLKNIQTISGITNLKFSEGVVESIPNIKKLRLMYIGSGLDEEVLPDYCINNLDRLQKLESLSLCFDDFRSNLVSFPQSLKKLSLYGTELSWEEFTTTIGSLPLLQFLCLDWDACRGSKWETVEGQFCCLIFLRIVACDDLKYWETDSAHFPRLEHLHLDYLDNFEEIPSCIGDISTLKSIRLERCRISVTKSAKRIIKEQKENGNEDLELQIENDYSSDED